MPRALSVILNITILTVCLVCLWWLHTVDWTLFSLKSAEPSRGISADVPTEHDKLLFRDESNTSVTLHMSLAEAEENLYRYLERTDVVCPNVTRMGGDGDGGWPWCMSGPYIPTKNNCLTYSFGIGPDWSFDDFISNPRKFNCTDRAFDPTIGLEDHVRRNRIYFYNTGLGGQDEVKDLIIARDIGFQDITMKTLQSLREDFNETREIIDYLKMDIEYSEWDALRTILYNNDLATVKQLGMEIHTREMFMRDPSSLADLNSYYDVFKQLEEAGFRKWFTHANLAATYNSPNTDKKRTCCYETVWINKNFLNRDYAPVKHPPKPKTANLRGMNWKKIKVAEAEDELERYIHSPAYSCMNVVKLGESGDYWHYCADSAHLTNPCYVGVMGHTMSKKFADDVRSSLGCSVKYLTSAKVAPSQKFEMLIMNASFESAQKRLGRISHDALKRSKQIVYKMDKREVTGRSSSISDYKHYYDVISKIKNIGYKQWLTKHDQSGMYHSMHTNRRRTNSFKIYFKRNSI